MGGHPLHAVSEGMGPWGGPLENWDAFLHHAEPEDIRQALMMGMGKGSKEFLARHGWCLLTAYKKMVLEQDALLATKVQLENALEDVRSCLSIAVPFAGINRPCPHIATHGHAGC